MEKLEKPVGGQIGCVSTHNSLSLTPFQVIPPYSPGYPPSNPLLRRALIARPSCSRKSLSFNHGRARSCQIVQGVYPPSLVPYVLHVLFVLEERRVELGFPLALAPTLKTVCNLPD